MMIDTNIARRNRFTHRKYGESRFASGRLLQAAALMAALSMGAQAGAVPSAAHHPAMLPDRLLRCTLGRVTNFDPRSDQKPADLHYEGQHAFTLFLPAIAVRTTEPPDPVEAPEPVNPQTRIIGDPDGLVRGAPPHFDRVVDYWPDRVELATTIDGPLVNMIVVHPVDVARGTANLFMTHATDLTALDMAHLYQGACSILQGPAARAAARPSAIASR